MVSIRRKILDKGKIVLEPLVRTLQDHENRIAALEIESSSTDGDKTAYNFVSYGDAQGSVEWGSGTAETTGVTKGNYTEIQVKTNSPDESFVGAKFFIISSAKANGTSIYKLYTDAGSSGAGIWVSISEVV